MTPTIQDRWLWLGLGVFTFVAIKGVSYALHNVVELNRVNAAPPPPPPQMVAGPRLKSADTISTASLEFLACHSTNFDIRKATTVLLCQRFWSDPDLRAGLKRDRTSHDPETRRKAEWTSNLLTAYGFHDGSDVRGPLWADEALLNSITAELEQPANATERERRRRRREAVVINEGDHPVSREDVYMRDSEGRLSNDES